jgi:hypothetical protein
MEMAMAIRVEESLNLKRGEAEPDLRLDATPSVIVVFTSTERTWSALEKAREIAQPAGAQIIVVAVQVVPFPLRLEEPPVRMEFVLRHFEEMASTFPEKIRIAAYLCRDPMEAFQRILNRPSPVVIGVKKRWIPSRDERLARKLRRAGYDIILVKTE